MSYVFFLQYDDLLLEEKMINWIISTFDLITLKIKIFSTFFFLNLEIYFLIAFNLARDFAVSRPT